MLDSAAIELLIDRTQRYGFNGRYYGDWSGGAACFVGMTQRVLPYKTRRSVLMCLEQARVEMGERIPWRTRLRVTDRGLRLSQTRAGFGRTVQGFYDLERYGWWINTNAPQALALLYRARRIALEAEGQESLTWQTENMLADIRELVI